MMKKFEKKKRDDGKVKTPRSQNHIHTDTFQRQQVIHKIHTELKGLLTNFRYQSDNVMLINPDSDPVTTEICSHS